MVAPSASGTLIYLHMPKAAGTTLRRIVRRQQRASDAYLVLSRADATAEVAELDEEFRSGLGLVMGHMAFGVHEALAQPASYLTTLRAPADRVLSHYYRARRNPSSPLYAAASRMGIGEFVASGVSAETNDNMTRILAGLWVEPFEQFEPCTTADLERALHNLATHFPVVGLAERFDESLLLMKAAYGWRGIHYSKRNTTRRRPRVESLSTSERSIIERNNRLDLELYLTSVRRFDEYAGRASVQEDLRSFRRWNAPRRVLGVPYDLVYEGIRTRPWARRIRSRVRRRRQAHE